MQATYLAKLVLFMCNSLRFSSKRNLFTPFNYSLYGAQQTLAFRRGYVPETFRERQNREVQA